MAKLIAGFEADVFRALLANPQDAKVFDSDDNAYAVEEVISVKKEAVEPAYGQDYSGYHIILKLRDTPPFLLLWVDSRNTQNH